MVFLDSQSTAMANSIYCSSFYHIFKFFAPGYLLEQQFTAIYWQALVHFSSLYKALIQNMKLPKCDGHLAMTTCVIMSPDLINFPINSQNIACS